MSRFLLTTLDRDRVLGLLAVGIIVTLLGVPAAAQGPPRRQANPPRVHGRRREHRGAIPTCKGAGQRRVLLMHRSNGPPSSATGGSSRMKSSQHAKSNSPTTRRE